MRNNLKQDMLMTIEWMLLEEKYLQFLEIQKISSKKE